MVPDIFFAHSRSNSPPETWEPLDQHLRRVADVAAQFAESFESAEWGRAAGLWHDVGKYLPAFQRRICGSPEHVDHAAPGAVLAVQMKAAPLAPIIAGHHAGLANPTESIAGGPLPLYKRLQAATPALQEIRDVIPGAIADTDIPRLPSFLRAENGQRQDDTDVEMWIRILFSAVVDADYLATEAFYGKVNRAVVRHVDAITALCSSLDERLARFRADTPVNIIRADVLAQCRAAAADPPGIFSLSVPTGGGKTLSSLAFALEHAQTYGKQRVIVVIPFTSIIEQTAKEYRDPLGARNVVEHHSAFDAESALHTDSELEIKRHLATENWDAPIIVTTAVQFFESLFANSPSHCRKLHNIVNSVIVIDEAQTLPVDFLIPVLDAIRQLVSHYGCTILFSTATQQPALQRREALPQGFPESEVRQIIRDPATLAGQLRRVEVEWPVPDEITPYEVLARNIADLPQALAIVHRRDDARTMAAMLPSVGRYHLSALMCAAHRSATLRQVKAAVRAGEPCRLVSTQLVEAGVDVDFPVVYRAMAGLDSLAQAAGRCNREGLLMRSDRKLMRGRFVVFNAETAPPRGIPFDGASITRTMLAEHGAELNFGDDQYLSEYFRRLYMSKDKDKHHIMRERRALNFATVAEKFRLIDDGFRISVVVPWDDSDERLKRFKDRPSRDTQRALQPYLVQVRNNDIVRLETIGAIQAVEGTDVYAVTELRRDMYHPEFGLLVGEDNLIDPRRLII